VFQPPRHEVHYTRGNMTTAATTMGGRRLGMDQLVHLMTEPCFVMRHRRMLPMAERAGHVSATMLSLESPRSRYVRRWKRHARSCSSCALVFSHLGISLK